MGRSCCKNERMKDIPQWFQRQWSACRIAVRYAGEFYATSTNANARRDHWTYFSVHEGELAARSFRFNLTVPAGHAVVLPPYWHAGIGSTVAGKRVVATNAGFDIDVFGETGNPIAPLGLPVVLDQRRMKGHDEACANVVSCFYNWKAASSTCRARAGNWFALLLLDYLETGFTGDVFSIARLWPVPEWVQKLADQLNMMAARAGFKTTALYRSSGYHRNRVTSAFKKYFGETPTRMLTRRRLELAMERLTSNPELSLSEVAVASGYSSQAVFNRSFLRLTGKTPGQFRHAGVPRGAHRK